MLLVQGGAPSSLVLDAADGRTLAAFAAAHSRWCPDSKPLLASLAEDRVTVRDLREDLVFEASARAFAWEPGCERLALLRADGKLELWTPGTEGAPTVLGDHDDASEVLFSPVGGTIATVGGDVRLWGPSPGESRGRLAAVPVFERSLARFDREGARFGAYDDSGLGIWQVDVARRIASLALAPEERGPFEIVGDEVFLMRAGHLLRWQVQSGEQQRVARSSTSAPVTGLWWSADDSKLALVRADGVTRVIDLASASALQQVFPTQAARSRWLAERGFAAAGKVTPEPSRLHVEPHGAVTVRADSGDGVLARFAAPTSGGPAAALRPDERAVALRAWDGTVRIYELAPFRLVAKVSEPEPTSGLVWHPNGELLLLEGSTPSLRSGADGSLVRSLGDQRALPSWGRRERDRLDLLHGEFSPDGCVLHTYGHGSHWLRDARSGNWLADFDQDGSVGPVAWAHTHAVVALVTEDGDVLLWRSHDGRRLTLHAEELGGELALVAYGDDGLWAGDSRAAGGARFRIGDDLLAGETRALEELPRRQHLPTLAGDFVEGRRLDFP
jgi:WD40 repeat protein